MIVTSAAFQQSSAAPPEKLAIDRENRWLWRFAPRRLEGEAIRDSLLETSGLLDPTMYGPGSLDTTMRRRSVYFFIKRSQLIPFLMLFDWPEHLVSLGRRSETTIAPQALALMNDPTVRDAASAVAERIGAATPEESVAAAYRQIHAREPTAEEAQQAVEFLAAQREAHASSSIDSPEHRALADLCQALLVSNEFLHVD